MREERVDVGAKELDEHRPGFIVACMRPRVGLVAQIRDSAANNGQIFTTVNCMVRAHVVGPNTPCFPAPRQLLTRRR